MQEKKPILSNLDGARRQDKILLKRAVGRKIYNVDAPTLSAFYANVFCPKWMEEKAFYVACLCCEQGKNGTTELPVAWASFSKKKDIKNNVIARLVDQPWSDNVALSLTRIVRRMIAEGYSIDFEKLLNDIIYWNSDITRLAWARKISRTEEDK